MEVPARGWLTGPLCAAALASLPWAWLAPGAAAFGLLAVCGVAALGLAFEAPIRRRRDEITPGLGALAGFLVALLAHPSVVLVWAAIGQGDGGDGIDEVVAGLLVGTGFTLLVWGWVTLPAGALAGWLAGRRVRRRPAGTV